MSVQPVIQREVRVASRRRETWWLRIAFAGGALAAFLLGMVWPDVSPVDLGQVVLICLSICGFILSVFAGPYLTADAISRERREGTLGLLFLTPLNAWQVVTGKMATHTLQVGYGWVAVFPIFFLPVLLGGVVPAEVGRLLFVLLVTLLLSVACGLFWSTVCTEVRNAVLATISSMLLLVFLPWLGVLMEELLSTSLPDFGLFLLSPMTALVSSFQYQFNRGGITGSGLNLSGSEIFWSSAAVQLVLAVALVVATCILLPRIWKRVGSGETRVGRATVDRDGQSRSRRYPAWLPPIKELPLLWFFGRSLAGSAWLRIMNLLIWFLFILMLLLAITDAAEKGFIAAFCLAYARHLLLRVHFAFDATRQLQEDRGSGALELLLTTPVEVGQIASGHGKALRRSQRQALAGTLAMNGLLEVWIFLLYDHLDMDQFAWLIFSMWFVGGALLTLSDMRTLRWLAIRQAGHPRSQLKAAGIILSTLQIPTWLLFVLAFIISIESGEEEVMAMIFAAWIVACMGYNAWLVRRCRTWLRTDFRRHAAGDR